MKGRYQLPAPTLNRAIILAAIEGFEGQKRRLDDQIAELRQLLGGQPAATPTTSGTKRGRRRMSAEGRARIAEAQRKRWAAKNAAEPALSAAPPQAAKPKRRLSAAGRKAIAEATRKRWARVRAEAAKAAKSQRAPSPKKARRREAAKATRKTAKKAPQATGAPAAQGGTE